MEDGTIEPVFKPNMQQHPLDIAKDYDRFENDNNHKTDIQTKPEEFSKAMVRKGLLDPETGMHTGNSKQGHILMHNVRGYSEQGKRNYERIFGHS